jgi:hypothetical protein
METADTIAGPRADRTPAEALAAVQQALKQQRRDGVRLDGFAEMALTLSPADLSGAGIEPHAPPSAKWAKETRAIVAEYYRQRGGYV